MGLKKLDNGRWEGSYRDPAGKEHIKRHPTRTDAQYWLAAKRAAIGRGDYVDPRLTSATFREHADTWLATLIHVRPKTRSDYATSLRTHVIPTFGTRPIGSIGHNDIRVFVAAMTATGAKPGTVDAARKVLRLVLNTAVHNGALRINPCDGIRVARPAREPMLFLTVAEIEHLADAITPPYGALIRFAAYTGLRAGEIGALRAGRVDLARSRVRVEESVTEVPGHGLVYGPPKTNQHRSTPIPASVRDELAALIDGHGPDDFVFTAPHGGPLRHKNFYRRFFKPAVTAAGLPGALRFHDYADLRVMPTSGSEACGRRASGCLRSA